MQLYDDDICEFRDLWEQEFHERLSIDEARRQASLFLDLYTELYLSQKGEATEIQTP